MAEISVRKRQENTFFFPSELVTLPPPPPSPPRRDEPHRRPVPSLARTGGGQPRTRRTDPPQPRGAASLGAGLYPGGGRGPFWGGGEAEPHRGCPRCVPPRSPLASPEVPGLSPPSVPKALWQQRTPPPPWDRARSRGCRSRPGGGCPTQPGRGTGTRGPVLTPAPSRNLCPDGADCRSSSPGPTGGTAPAPSISPPPPVYTGLTSLPPLPSRPLSAPHLLPGDPAAPAPLPLPHLVPAGWGESAPNDLRTA